jgi:hypothetical protein
MKLKTVHIVLIFIFVALLIAIFSKAGSVVPYSKDTLFSNMYKYEGLVGGMSPEQAFSEKKGDGVEGIKNQIKEMYNKQVNGVANENVKTDKQVEGFALQPAPFNGEHELDIYTKVQGSATCFSKSAGLTNSMGGLCLEGESLRLLTTRGGNSTPPK